MQCSFFHISSASKGRRRRDGEKSVFILTRCPCQYIDLSSPLLLSCLFPSSAAVFVDDVAHVGGEETGQEIGEMGK